MKKTLAFVVSSVFLFSGAALAAETTATLKVSGWHCAGCGNRTAKAVKAIDGVVEAKTDVEAKTLTVTYDDEKTSEEAVEKAVAALKYKIEK